KVWRDKLEVEGAGPPELDSLCHRSWPPSKTYLLPHPGSQMRGGGGRQPTVDLVETAARTDRGERGGQPLPLRSGVMHVVRRDNGQSMPGRQAGKRVVA